MSTTRSTDSMAELPFSRVKMLFLATDAIACLWCHSLNIVGKKVMGNIAMRNRVVS